MAYGDTRTHSTVGVVVFTLGLPLKALLFWQFGIVGLAAATSIATLGTAAIHQYILTRRVRRFLSEQTAEK